MTSPSERKRLGRTSEAHKMREQLFAGQRSCRIGVHVWPDVFELLTTDAAKNGITISGMAHRIFRDHYSLPPIP